MSRRSQTMIKGAVIGLILLTAACATTAENNETASPTEVVSADGAAGTKDRDDPGPMPEEDYGDVPSECVAAGIPSAPSDWANVERAPEAWPDAPAGAHLCITSSTTDANIATFVSSEAWEDTLGYYEPSLAERGASDLARVRGEDTGTGYEQLEGTLDGAVFLIRESDSGFSLVFASTQ